jgi:hypothetical protein
VPGSSGARYQPLCQSRTMFGLHRQDRVVEVSALMMRPVRFQLTAGPKYHPRAKTSRRRMGELNRAGFVGGRIPRPPGACGYEA